MNSSTQDAGNRACDDVAAPVLTPLFGALGSPGGRVRSERCHANPWSANANAAFMARPPGLTTGGTLRGAACGVQCHAHRAPQWCGHSARRLTARQRCGGRRTIRDAGQARGRLLRAWDGWRGRCQRPRISGVRSGSPDGSHGPSSVASGRGSGRRGRGSSNEAETPNLFQIPSICALSRVFLGLDSAMSEPGRAG
jgi:hypothetical protein